MAVLPTTLLPALPRAQGTLAPLQPADLLGCMSVLKDLYMPPIHGGFQAGDVELEEPDHLAVEARERATSGSGSGSSSGSGSTPVPVPARRRRTMSGGSVDLVPGLGLEMDGLSVKAIAEEDEDALDEDDEYSDDHDEDSDSDDEGEHNDPFEREWAEKWLGGVVRRAQTWLEENDGDDGMPEIETVLREATAVLAMMAGTSAAGSLTRHLLFPVAPELAPALRSLRPDFAQPNPALSPTTSKFVASLATSPVSPLMIMKPLRKRGDSTSSTASTPPAAAASSFFNNNTTKVRGRRTAAVPVLLHDAPMQDHLSVGVQTWGSAILLGREMALRPADFGLFQSPLPHAGYTRVLELGAGTGLLSILCRKLLDLRAAGNAITSNAPAEADAGLIVATDFLPEVLANLRVCVDLNAPPRLPSDDSAPGIDIAKLDWTTFPAYMERRAGLDVPAGEGEEEEELAPWVDTPFDLVLASDCVYDPTHAALLRKVAAWVLRPPTDGAPSGTMHLLSPIRPTFTPELESIDAAFPPLASYTPLADRAAAAGIAFAADPVRGASAVPDNLRGEGLGAAAGLRLGVRGVGKKSVKGRRGEGRQDEWAGYWWWEVAWG